jgi:hypothetical protein
MKSSCCNAEIKVWISHSEKKYEICLKCGMPCSPKPLSSDYVCKQDTKDFDLPKGVSEVVVTVFPPTEEKCEHDKGDHWKSDHQSCAKYFIKDCPYCPSEEDRTNEEIAENLLESLIAFNRAVNGYHHGWASDIDKDGKFDYRYKKRDIQKIAEVLDAKDRKTPKREPKKSNIDWDEYMSFLETQNTELR